MDKKSCYGKLRRIKSFFYQHFILIFVVLLKKKQIFGYFREAKTNIIT